MNSSDSLISELEYPWRHEGLMRRLYVEEKMSQTEIADRLGCAPSTVVNWLDEHDIETRSISEGQVVRYGTENCASYLPRKNGTVEWNTTIDGTSYRVYVHRLLAVAKYGFDAVVDHEVHHKNHVPWDNRPSNIELLTKSEHSSHHKKLSGIDRIRVAELYENGDLSSRKLAAHVEYETSPATILAAHKEMFGGDA